MWLYFGALSTYEIVLNIFNFTNDSDKKSLIGLKHFMEWVVGKTFSYDALDDDFVEDEYEMVGRNQHDKNKQKVKKKLEDYLEQKRLRKNLGEDDLDEYLND
ncbi:hypothetical protein PMAG_a4138 [Pseudoalteromonas mariniglutinosa NCIMB 1770]|nr:hypothetical protein [Pseudoalteromonas mariniglutinosa NCIMB 1770]